jgi:hypothetical protein
MKVTEVSEPRTADRRCSDNRRFGSPSSEESAICRSISAARGKGFNALFGAANRVTLYRRTGALCHCTQSTEDRYDIIEHAFPSCRAAFGKRQSVMDSS